MFTRNNYSNLSVYNTGLYLRLSREDEESGQSMSIKNQQDYLMNFILENGWNVTEIYIDDGYSGLNFDRPAFKKMIADIENKKINLVITKDLSRLGRDYIDTGYYIERYFPQKNVRYIALSDGIDTFTKSANNDMTPFKSVLNDMYAKDISKKIRTVMDTKRVNGQFIGAFAPFGYIKSPENNNVLLIDEVAAEIVKRIFAMYMCGNSMTQIANTFTKENIPTPTTYKRDVQKLSYVNVNTKYNNIWRTETIKGILTNPTYIGNMAQHRSEKISYKMNKFKKIPRKDWIIAENTHEPIISKEDYLVVQEQLKRKANILYPVPRVSHLLGGIIFCGDCGMPFTFRRVGSKKEFICMCSGYSRFGKEMCQRNVIKETVLNEYVLKNLKDISNKVIQNKKEFCNSFKMTTEVDETEKALKKETTEILRRLDDIKKIIKSLYEDKVRGIVTESDFLSMSSEYNEEKEMLSKRLLAIDEEKGKEKEVKTPEKIIELIQSIVSFDKVSPLLIGQLIDNIKIYKPNKIEINYKFQNPFD